MDQSQIASYLELFDLPDAFTEAQLKQAYHDLVQVWHPDKHSQNERLRKKADEKMKEINQAYEVLQAGLVNGMFRFERFAPRPEAKTPETGWAGTHHPAEETHTQSGEPTPQQVPHAATVEGERKGLSGSMFWMVILGLMLLGVIVAPHGKKGAPLTVAPPVVPRSDAEPPQAFSIQGPLNWTNTADTTISRALDSRYGFKELRFGMSINEARRQLNPDRMGTNQFDELVTFWYGPGPENNLGDFPLDYMNAYFFRDRLFKIEVSFSSNQAEIFSALQTTFGAPRANDSLTRDSAPLRAECWFGERAFCALVGPWNSDAQTGWDAMVMYDQALYREAQRYAAAEPLRAAQALSEEGFGQFKFGMTVKEFSRKLLHPPDVSDIGVGQKAAVVPQPEDSRLGPYPLSSVRASFFQEKLFRIDLGFEVHGREIFQGFTNRFPLAEANDSWSRNGETLMAKQFSGQRAVAVILASRAFGAQWDTIILYDRQMDEQRRAYEREAPNRAAKDL